MDIYRDAILDHYKHPRNFGALPSPTHTAEEYNATCGDRMRIEVLVQDGKTEPIVADIRFSGEGCAISQASASMLTERVLRRPVSEVLRLSPQYVFDMLGASLTPSRVKCALLPLEVLQKAVLKEKTLETAERSGVA
ncbi:iron-sulfur cluster assembly scaffold protein [Patescibacteria group bacterium]|nr:iron-sulfur cluster assembly scaffold protein [Patescibacteria group bacterium]